MNESTLARFWAKVDKNGPIPPRAPHLGSCWTWRPVASVGGYGQFYIEGRPQLAHRASYKLLVGPIPPKFTIDHLCCVRSCVNPDHLEAVTLAENLRRMRAWDDFVNQGAEFQRSKTHCSKGHEYTAKNTRVTKAGKRECRTCERARMAAWRLAHPVVPKPRTRETCRNGHPFAEFGVVRGMQRACLLCERDRSRKARKRRRQQNPPEPKLTCKHGHPWNEENIYTDPRGRRSCRACHNERTLAAYHDRQSQAAPREAQPPRDTCRNGHPWIPENLYQTAEGYDRCRLCRRRAGRCYEARLSAARRAAPKRERTTCRNGHDLTGENAYVSAGGHRTCRECVRLRREARAERIAAGGPAVIDPARASWQRDKTHCKNGHEFTPENTIVRPDGGRKCRECGRIRSREHMRAKRAADKPAAGE